MRDGVTIIRIPRKGGKMRTDYEHIQSGRDNAAKSLRFERKKRREAKTGI
jgi:uncharacterized protein YceH (UPF0502 family)